MPPDSSPGRIYTEINRFSPRNRQWRSDIGFGRRWRPGRSLRAGGRRSERRSSVKGNRCEQDEAQSDEFEVQHPGPRRPARQPPGAEKGGSPHQPHPGTRVRRCRCSLPGLTGFTTWRCEGTDADRRRPCALSRRRARISRVEAASSCAPRHPRHLPGPWRPARMFGPWPNRNPEASSRRQVRRSIPKRQGAGATIGVGIPKRQVAGRCDDRGMRNSGDLLIADSPCLPYPLRPPERCPSGRRSTPGKCVYVDSVPRVRIPPSPPITQLKQQFTEIVPQIVPQK